MYLNRKTTVSSHFVTLGLFLCIGAHDVYAQSACDQRLCWTEVTENVLKCASTTGLNIDVVTLSINTIKPNGIAYCSANNKLYWTN